MIIRVPLTEEELNERVKVWLIRMGVPPELKGFDYMVDMILTMKKIKKYSRAKPNELYGFIAEKYGIEEHSVQRQLRYACTLKNIYSDKVLPIELLDRAFHEIKLDKEIEEE